MFIDRQDAGQRLGEALKKYSAANALVLAIPRGGVKVGYYVALRLKAKLAVVVSRKLPHPDNPEFGFGAVAEDGSVYLVKHVADALGREIVSRTIVEQREVIKRRIMLLRGGAPLPEIFGRTVLLVDDGIAMGSTIQAAAALVRNRAPGRLVIAAPVSDRSKPAQLQALADEVVILETPANFYAVAQVYQDWHDLTDQEVIKILKKYKSEISE